MLGSISLISCNFSRLPRLLKPSTRPQTLTQSSSLLLLLQSRASSSPHRIALFPKYEKKVTFFHICKSSSNNPEEPEKTQIQDEGRDWSSSILLFALWGALLYYCFNLAPDQTPTQDLYFLKKLLNLKGDDGFRMNQILVGLWYIMGLWPLVYAMLLLPTGTSKTPAWPFVVLSFFGGVYALLPYFALWNPPSPPVSETELRQWPLNVLESKVTAGVTLVAGLGIILYSVVGNAGDWTEFYQYFRESKFIHVTSLDFCLLSAFAPFWVYNDMTTRKWFDKGSWLLPVSVIPFLGPSLYLLLRPAVSETIAPKDTASSDPNQ
ncbi:hypothetical protein AtNW77_Chr2g0224871 [Arabidopsis thaliana]|jgi:hypothetical protein|uniref:Transmembrane protein n=4 Tax=Arabidopsis TaxID=3701 RepID=A0A654ERU9_ARATH|nr:uncharacterized protein AT2G04360 [Arabidopsis thaliana]KAG7635840.1 hypothetical protein ISN45_At02g003320 [Arabidopsis thaliana x Arabidopsis arenosa]KAG7640493.1 hypothetical protein ISN44_As02g003390 [Arabidopsis suecica]ABD59050.1 At2g04360 [Arabidopsis thaliana]AEC05824.1 transmembrane protein [Arabidopsis thaliana]CAA0357299.1 unnamed protein product [Arabidopsis thaliana]|eukprot:NP_178517.2 transmembrane protein [Arabidopsis thaliana]